MSSVYSNKSKLVEKVFNSVHKKYDMMNDIMSLGAHRIWKKNLISWVGPSEKSKIIDVASGTGDIAKLCSDKTNNKCEIKCVEPNKNMLIEGQKKLQKLNNLTWVLSSAENLPFKNNTFDFYIISFGIRNVSNLEKSLKEAHRVLKRGGRFFCLEFSKVENELLSLFYKNYSKAIPTIGKFITGDKDSYSYLVSSIDKFHNQRELKELIEDNGFVNVEYRNLSNGIAAIHTGWKI